jgi:HK97 family phage prohead protease
LFLERIARGAFARSFREKGRGIKVLLEHGHDPVVGNKPLGAPSRLEEDARGAAYEVPRLDTSYTGSAAGVAEGLYGASFRFRVPEGGDTWTERPGRSSHNPDGIPERTLVEVDLSEFGPVTWPAYEAATAGVA